MSLQNEAVLTAARIKELELDPVRGRFDTTHLREIHRYITQDIPEHCPGQFRPDTGTHVKARELSTGLRYEVPYEWGSRIEGRLQELLDRRDLVAEFKGLDKVAFTARMSTLYGDLDQVHPFAEANSRTLRAFTAQLAEASGHSLDWRAVNDMKNSRDRLYLARDHEVFRRAFPGIDRPGFEPATRMQAEAENIMQHAGRAYPTLDRIIEHVHRHRLPVCDHNTDLSKGRGLDR